MGQVLPNTARATYWHCPDVCPAKLPAHLTRAVIDTHNPFALHTGTTAPTRAVTEVTVPSTPDDTGTTRAPRNPRNRNRMLQWSSNWIGASRSASGWRETPSVIHEEDGAGERRGIERLTRRRRRQGGRRAASWIPDSPCVEDDWVLTQRQSDLRKEDGFAFSRVDDWACA